MKKPNFFTAGIIMCMVMLMLPMTAGAADTKDTESLLRGRVEAMMQAKIDGKWDVVYTYYDSSYRNRITQDQFSRKRRAMKFMGFQVESLEIQESGEEAKVVVSTDISARGFDFKGVKEKHTWINESDGWFYKVMGTDTPFGNIKPMKKKGKATDTPFGNVKSEDKKQ